MSGAAIRLENGGEIGRIVLDRPERANAYTDSMLADLQDAVARCIRDASVRVVVFASAVDGVFCGGADLDELKRRSAEDAFVLRSAKVFDCIAACPKPTIAVVDGSAVAGGLELALACDLRLASERASFRLPETSLGILPAAGGLERLPRIVGDAAARSMVLFGVELSASQALQSGLVSEVVRPEDLESCLHRWVEIAGRVDPLAFRLAKRVLALSRDERERRELVAAAQALLYQRHRSEDTE